jgi:hypothetical protein
MKKEDTTQEDIKEAYSAWSKTYDEVKSLAFKH